MATFQTAMGGPVRGRVERVGEDSFKIVTGPNAGGTAILVNATPKPMHPSPQPMYPKPQSMRAG
jgi:hypothetical protein